MEGFVWLPLKEYEEMKADLASLIEHALWLGAELRNKQEAMDTTDYDPGEVHEAKDRNDRVRDIVTKYP